MQQQCGVTAKQKHTRKLWQQGQQNRKKKETQQQICCLANTLIFRQTVTRRDEISTSFDLKNVPNRLNLILDHRDLMLMGIYKIRLAIEKLKKSHYPRAS